MEPTVDDGTAPPAFRQYPAELAVQRIVAGFCVAAGVPAGRTACETQAATKGRLPCAVLLMRPTWIIQTTQSVKTAPLRQPEFRAALRRSQMPGMARSDAEPWGGESHVHNCGPAHHSSTRQNSQVHRGVAQSCQNGLTKSPGFA